MAKNKKESSAKNANLGKPTVEHVSPVKKKKGEVTVWDHHDTMIVNLRMWVEREIDNLNNDIRTHTPGLVAKPKLAAVLEKAQELNIQLWDQIRIAQEMADSHKEAV